MTGQQLMQLPTDAQGGVMGGVTVGLSATQVVGANQKRRSLTLTALSSGGVTFGTNAAVTSGQGPTLSTTSGPLALDIEHHGSLVKGPWYAIGTNAADSVGFIDVNDGS